MRQKQMLLLICSACVLLSIGFARHSTSNLSVAADNCYVYGRVTYQDGSACRNCCSVQAETSGGGAGTMSKEVCTNSDGDYRLDLAYCEVKTVFFKGKTVWEGNKSAKGGARIDLRAN